VIFTSLPHGRKYSFPDDDHQKIFDKLVQVDYVITGKVNNDGYYQGC
jgi:multimeric flavodoxin WrbA